MAKKSPIKGAGVTPGSSPIASNVPDFAQVRFNTSISHPYFQHVLFKLIPVETDKIPTLAVDKHWRLYYNPNLLASLPMDQAIGCLIHEIHHCIRMHHDRFAAAQYPKIANIAEDMEINDDFKKEGLKLPDFVVYPNKDPYKFKEDLMAEEYYEMLLKDADKFFKCSGNHKDGDSGGDVPVKCNCPRGKGESNPQPGGGNCGSIAANPGEWELDAPNEQDKDANGNPIPRVEKWEQEAAQREPAKAVQEYQKTRGNCPGSLVRWADTLLKPKVNWRKEIRTVVCGALNLVEGMADYSYKKRHRKQEAFPDYIRQGFISYTPNIALIPDTSGSMSPEDMGRALAELEGIFKTSRAAVQVVCCDMSVTFDARVTNKHQVKFNGGGGTDMRVAFDYLEHVKPKPDIIVIVTDGYTPWPAHPNKGVKRTIAVIVHEGGFAGVPDWMKKVLVTKEDR